MVSACSHYRLETYRHIDTAQTSLNRALNAGAAEIAPDNVTDAQHWLRQANEQVLEDDFEDARRSANEAKSLAELATAKLRAAGIIQERDLLQGEIARMEVPAN